MRKPTFEAKPEPRLSLEEIHRNGGFIVLQPHVDRFPAGINKTGFESLPDALLEKSLYPLVEASRNYYGGYLIRDPFGQDEEKRLAWQNAMLREYTDRSLESYENFQRRSKLRLATIQSVQGLLLSFVKQLDEHDVHTPQAEKIRSLADSLPPIVNVARKTEFTGLTDDLAARLRAALDSIPLNDLDKWELDELEDTSWKMMTYEKKVDVAAQIDKITEELLEMVTTPTDSQK